MSMLWVMPDTGEIVPAETAGAIEIEGDVGVSEDTDAEWLGDWLTQQHVRLDAEEVAVKAQAARRIGRLRARRAYLVWAYEARMRRVVQDELAGGRRKSVHFAYGTAGFRTTTRTVVDDADAALAWAQEHAPEAVKITPPALLKSRLPKEAPGVHQEREESFYVRAAK